MLDFKPMDTAPKDGTELILRVPIKWEPLTLDAEQDERVGKGNHIVSAWFDTDGRWRTRLDTWFREESPDGWRLP